MKKIGALHVLTDTVLQTRYTHAELARMAVAGGADTVQYRQKTGHTRDMIESARAMRDICVRSGVPLIVNDRVDVASRRRSRRRTPRPGRLPGCACQKSPRRRSDHRRVRRESRRGPARHRGRRGLRGIRAHLSNRLEERRRRRAGTGKAGRFRPSRPGARDCHRRHWRRKRGRRGDVRGPRHRRHISRLLPGRPRSRHPKSQHPHPGRSTARS